MAEHSTPFKSFSDFYPYYLKEHSNPTCRTLHFIGSWIVLFILATAIFLQNAWLLLLMPLAGYGFAWVGHFFTNTINLPLLNTLGTA